MMNEDTSSIDLSVSFFASVLVLFVFVTLSIVHFQPQSQDHSVGQTVPVFDAVPPSWSPVPERTSFALLVDGGLAILDLGHFARTMQSASNGINIAPNFEDVRPIISSAAPQAHKWKITTNGHDLPSEWVRFWIDNQALSAPSASADCPLTEEQRKLIPQRTLTVFLAPDAALDLAGFIGFASSCGYRFRLIPLAPANSDTGSFSIPLELDARMFALQQMFR